MPKVEPRREETAREAVVEMVKVVPSQAEVQAQPVEVVRVETPAVEMPRAPEHYVPVPPPSSSVQLVSAANFAPYVEEAPEVVAAVEVIPPILIAPKSDDQGLLPLILASGAGYVIAGPVGAVAGAAVTYFIKKRGTP